MSMWRQRFPWPITVGPCSGEGPHSGSRLTGEPRERYAQVREKVLLIRRERGNWGRRTIYGTVAEPIRGSKTIGDRFFGPKPTEFWGSRNNSGRTIRTILRATLLIGGVVLAIGAMSCSAPNENWEMFRATGLWDSLEHVEAIVFLDDEVGILGATRLTEDPPGDFAMMGDAMIYRTSDGGRAWSPACRFAAGFRDLARGQGCIYALLDVLKEDHPHPLSEVWTSTDRGKSWHKAYATNWPFYIMKLVGDPNGGCAAVFRELTPNGRSKVTEWIKHSRDRGRTWETGTELTDIGRYNNIVFRSGRVWFFSGSSEPFLSQVNLDRGTTSLFKSLGRFRVPVIAADATGRIGIVDEPQARGVVRLSLLNADGMLATTRKLTGVVHGIPYSFHVSGTALSLIIGGHGSILGVTHHFYRSLNLGETWKEEKLPFTLIVKPAAYLGDDLVWLAAGGGSIQRRGFRSP